MPEVDELGCVLTSKDVFCSQLYPGTPPAPIPKSNTFEILPLPQSTLHAEQQSGVPTNSSQHVDSHDNDKRALVNKFGIHSAHANDILGYGDDDDDDEDMDDEEFPADNGDSNGGEDEIGDTFGGLSATESISYTMFQTQIRWDMVQHTERNRQQGGLQTQKAMVQAWKEFLGLAR
ncbi:hypothetical protein HGRIS_006597 [Hohenbuehelia grisea]|uniref:Uncharacterized protein n=1 Tax=Hohenbuehelia grisea TaxID=104357 RepID=A0ABR3J9Z4_9AGAR